MTDLLNGGVEVLLELDAKLLSQRSELSKVLLVLLVVLNLGLDSCETVSRRTSRGAVVAGGWMVGGWLGGDGGGISVVGAPAAASPRILDCRAQDGGIGRRDLGCA